MIDLITVVFRDEIPLLRIQAESINQYFDSKDIGSIIVVVNDTDDLVDLIDLSWWHHTNVKIIPYSHWKYTCKINGWENQQLCKLLAASEATSAWSMVLDAKTWFIKPFSVEKLFDSQGRARVGRGQVIECFRSSSEFVEQLYDIDLSTVLGPNGVPYVFHTETAHELVISQDNFIEFFQTNVRYPNLLIEFHLYPGYVIKKYGSLDVLYSPDQYICPVNLSHSESMKFDTIFKEMHRWYITTVSVHRRAYADLTPDQRQRWQEFLIVKKLLQPSQDSLNLLNTFIH